MTRGATTPFEVREQFRADYLYSGNASASARRCGIGEQTGRDLVAQFSNEPEFVEARRALRARALDEAERAVMRVVSVAERRFRSKGPQVPEDSKFPVTIVDKRADYGKLIVDAHRSLTGRARLDAECSGQVASSRDVTINVKLAEEEPRDAGTDSG
ncbi:MAG: hypothetical protein WC551_07535 [Patescibacteria group bacterium]